MINLSYSPELSIFQGLDETILERFAIREFQPKEHIIVANTLTPLNLFLILRGVCVVSKAIINYDTWCSTPYRITSGDFVGLIEAISPIPIKRMAYVTAKSPVVTLEIPYDEVRRWQTEEPELYNIAVIRTLDKQFNTRDILYHCSSLRAPLAGAYYFQYLYEIYQKSCYPENYRGPVRIWETHQDLSDAIVRNIRTIDRLISDFQNMGMLDIVKKSIYINHEQYLLICQYIKNFA